jgi:hypothetical protein
MRRMMAKHHWDHPLPSAEWDQLADPERFEKMRLQYRDTPASGIRLGSHLSTDDPAFITPRRLSTHMHVVGGTGVGKSYFLEGVIKNLILQGQGVCVIDPHGDLYEHLLAFCVHLDRAQPARKLANRVIPFDVAERDRIVGFNPVQRNARVLTYQVLALMEAIRKCWGQDSFQETPRLARWLFNSAYAVIDGGLTLLQTQYLVDPKPNAYRDAITRQVREPRVRAEWEWFGSLRDRERNEFTESSFNRLQPFVVHETVRRILGQRSSTLDFSSILSGRKILLVNLAKQNTIPEDYQHLIGTLIVNEILTAAFARRPEERTPFYLFIDEFQHFVTKDMCEILDGGRKFGLHLVLAHQHLNQLKLKDPEVYYSTLANARIKAIFGGLIDEDLEVVANELYVGELNPDEVKDEIWQTKFRPVESSRIIRCESYSESTGTGYTEASSYGQVTNSALVAGETFIPGSGLWSADVLQGRSVSEASSYGSVQGSSRSYGQQSTSAYGNSTAEVPWYEYHEFSELSSRTFRSLEEQLYVKKAQMKRQPPQHIALLIPGKNVQLLKTPSLREFKVSDQELGDFKYKCFEAAGCYKTPEDADREVAEVEAKLLTEGTPVTEISAPAEEKPNPKKNKQTIFASIDVNDLIGRE